MVELTDYTYLDFVFLLSLLFGKFVVLLLLFLLTRLLELAVTGTEGRGWDNEVFFATLQPGPSLQVVVCEVLLSLALANVALNILMDLIMK